VASLVQIRRAKIKEVESICACLESAFEPFRTQYTPGAFQDTVPTPESMRQRLIAMTVYVAIAGGELVGTIASSMTGDEGHLRGMAVSPAWQGRGVAEQLLLIAEKDLLAGGCARITLETTMPLQRAIRFYQRNGFAATGRIADFFGMPLYEYSKPCRPRVAAPGHITR
jgi:ribosomal protein S18 acetylase RimI-like enzyme